MAFLTATALTIGATSVSVGSLLGAAGAVVGGIGALAAGNYQNAVAKQNAQIAEQNAHRARERAGIEAQDNDMQTLGMLGEQEAAQSASGISLTSRSSILTRKAAKELGRRDTLNIIQAGDVEAYNYKVDAANQRASGKAAKTTGVFNALGSFLSAGGSLAGGAKSVPNGSRFDPWVTRKGLSLRRAY